MKKLLLIFFCFCLLSCTTEKRYIKQLSIGTTEMDWYTEYSGLDNQSDFVKLEIGDSNQILLKASTGIADIELKKDTAIIKMYDLSSLQLINLTVYKNVQIKLDTSTTYNDYLKYNQSEYYNTLSDSDIIRIDNSTRFERMKANIQIK